MRPKKRMLVYCAEEDGPFANVAFLLRTHGYAVTMCRSHSAALDASSCEFDGVLLVESRPDECCAVLVDSLRPRLDPRCRVLLIAVGMRIPSLTNADRVLLADTMPAQLLEAIRILVARTRGPMGKRVNELPQLKGEAA